MKFIVLEHLKSRMRLCVMREKLQVVSCNGWFYIPDSRACKTVYVILLFILFFVGQIFFYLTVMPYFLAPMYLFYISKVKVQDLMLARSFNRLRSTVTQFVNQSENLK